MSELVVVTNRGPASLYVDDAGAIKARQAAGGLAPSLVRALEGTDAAWVAAAMTDLERRAAFDGSVRDLTGALDLHLVAIDEEMLAAAYRVISNQTLWFLHHGLFDRANRPIFNRAFYEAWEGYRAYNAAIAKEVCELADYHARVIVNDYHLCLLGSELARLRPDLRTVHFAHTPFCVPEELSVLPHPIASELMIGLCSFGSCGFHTARWAENFQACATQAVVAPPPLFVAPLGVDADHLASLAAAPECLAETEALRERLDGRKLIYRSDRIELSKNLIRGFLAFEELLVERPDWQGKVRFLARAYPLCEDLPEYLAYRSTAEHVVHRINERFSTRDDVTIEFAVEDDFTASLAASCAYDVLLVNPIRDGMNLVAKEGPVLNRNDGVLALSREAGAFAELKDGALALEPFDVTGTAAVLHAALTMPAAERAARSEKLHVLAASRPPSAWFEDLTMHARPGALARPKSARP